MDAEFTAERIAAIKAQIIAYEDALTALATDNITSYTIDTGQTRQTVTRRDIGQINITIGSLSNRLATLQARLNGASTYGGSAW